MSFVSVLLAPFALLFHDKAPAEPPPPLREPAGLTAPATPLSFGFDPSEEPGWELIAESFRVPSQDQVRIEQRITIRIAPHRPPMMQRNLMMDLPDRAVGRRFREKKMGDCLTVTQIAGVQVGDDGLVLHLRDHRMVGARLERTCRARDFYSGFYLQNSTDGRLCVDRDTLQSRNGATCKLTRMRQLIEKGD
jgi:hypothetical protein